MYCSIYFTAGIDFKTLSNTKSAADKSFRFRKTRSHFVDIALCSNLRKTFVHTKTIKLKY